MLRHKILLISILTFLEKVETLFDIKKVTKLWRVDESLYEVLTYIDIISVVLKELSQLAKDSFLIFESK